MARIPLTNEAAVDADEHSLLRGSILCSSNGFDDYEKNGEEKGLPVNFREVQEAMKRDVLDVPPPSSVQESIHGGDHIRLSSTRLTYNHHLAVANITQGDFEYSEYRARITTCWNGSGFETTENYELQEAYNLNEDHSFEGINDNISGESHSCTLKSCEVNDNSCRSRATISNVLASNTTRNHQSQQQLRHPSIPTVITVPNKITKLYFALTDDPGAARWRQICVEILDQVGPKVCTDDRIAKAAALRVKNRLEEEGIKEHYVEITKRRRTNGSDGHEGKSDKNPEDNYRKARLDEFIAKTAKRFKDQANQDGTPLSKRGRPNKKEAASALELHLKRESINVEGETAVCVGWNVHCGTKKWLSMLKEISDNPAIKWDDSVADDIKSKHENLPILVSLDSKGKFCFPYTKGLWYRASDQETWLVTKHQFDLNRRRAKHIAMLRDVKATPLHKQQSCFLP